MSFFTRINAENPQSQPLLKFPQLVQTKIIRMMTPPKQHLLSKCSQRTRQSVKNSASKKHNHEIWIQFRDVSVHYLLKTAGKMQLIHESPGEFSPEDHRYICDLFRAPSEIYVIWNGFELSSEEFASNNSIKRSNLLKSDWPHEWMKEYSELHTNQDLILLRSFYANSLKSGHSFLEARNLMIVDTKIYCVYPILLSFRGEHLLMEDVQLGSFFIRVFVEKWMKKSYDRLRTVIFQLHSDSIIRELEFEKFSGSDRKFQYDSPIKRYHQFPDGIFDCTNGYFIRRETDGKLATIKITRDYFMFLVW
ncbi:unnamed protein product [Caenorhabditis brenneri]